MVEGVPGGPPRLHIAVAVGDRDLRAAGGAGCGEVGPATTVGVLDLENVVGVPTPVVLALPTSAGSRVALALLCDHEVEANGLPAFLGYLRRVLLADRKAIGMRYHDGKPGIIEGLLSRGDRRVGKVILEAWKNGARFDGWSEHFSFDRWMAAAETGLQDEIVDVHWFTTRERLRTEVLPWDHLDSGLSSEWLWEDWQAALAEAEVGDCRWTPCSDCGVCDQLGTDIQVGPTGVTELPMPMLRPSVVG